jgi:hypothetical protein
MNPQSALEAIDTRPILKFWSHSVSDAAKQVIEAMRASGTFYVRRRGHESIHLWRRTEDGRMIRLSASAIRGWITEHFRCLQYDGRRRAHVPANPPPALSGWVTMQLAFEPKFPRITEADKP